MVMLKFGGCSWCVIFVSWVRVLRGALRKDVVHLRAPPLSAPFLPFYFQLPTHFFSPLTPLPCLLEPFSVQQPPPLPSLRKLKGNRERESKGGD